MTLLPVGSGLVASTMAFLIVCAWLAIGSVALRSIAEADDEIVAPAATLIGAGVTSFILALFARAGMVQSGVIVTGLLGLTMIAVRRKEVVRMLRRIVTQYAAIARTRAERACLAVLAVMLWLNAIAPPRSADAMRYHLAHIRQIVSDGGWIPIADYHYALPFGWSLSYLPFELTGLAQGAQLLGLWLFVVMLGALVKALQRAGVGLPAAAAAAVLLLHPFVLRTFTEANSDGYAILAVSVVALLLVRLPRATSAEIALLGLASWIGIQSRYQLIAVGIAATMITFVSLRSSSDLGAKAKGFGSGAVAALALASPFYVANVRDFGNPVWPLLISVLPASGSYADFVADQYSRSLTGSYAPDAIAGAVIRLMSTPSMFPLAIISFIIILAASISRIKPSRDLGRFGLVFFCLWLAIQPLLYPRFILLMLPVAVLCAGILLSAWKGRNDRSLLMVARIAAMACTIAVSVLSWDALRYSLTGDARTYHRFTWFYPVYEWVNRTTPPGSRVLAIVSSGHSYYLDRPYRRADPWLSGVVDWPRTTGGTALTSLLDRGGYRYVIYEDRDWDDFRGGSEMRKAISEAIAQGALRPLRQFDERLYTSRFRRIYRPTRVYVLARSGN